MKRLFLATILGSFACPAFAGGWTAFVIPTKIDVIGAGFMIYGDFGNPGTCTEEGRVFVKATNGNYSQIYAASLTALTSKYAVKLYIDGCEPNLWYALSSVTFNTLTDGAAFVISDE
jgi:hypothetical protein